MLQTNPHDAEQLAGLRILVVEDWLMVARELEEMLDRLRCEVVGPIPRLSRAIAAAEDADIDGAILDIDLNGEKVFPAAEVLRRRGVPFIFATGYDISHIPEAFRDEPRMEKPYSFSELTKMMSRVFASSGNGNGSHAGGQ